MPIYEYNCKSCGKHFEIMQKMADKPIKKCILCSNGSVEKIMSQSSFALKGSGWYKTDYASGKPCMSQTDAIGKKDDKQSPCANCPSAN